MKTTLLLLTALSLGRPAQANPPQNPALVRGTKLYQQHCAICHGEKGKGDGLAAKSLTPPPRDFSKGVFRYSKNEAERLAFVKKGKPPMPAWGGTLSEAELKDVLAFIHTLKR